MHGKVGPCIIEPWLAKQWFGRAEVGVIPSRYDILGRWSEGLGDDSFRGLVVEFSDDGSLEFTVNGRHQDRGTWECPAPGQLVLVTDDGLRHGPYRVTVEDRRLPGGTFRILEAEFHLYPMGLKQFTRLEG